MKTTSMNGRGSFGIRLAHEALRDPDADEHRDQHG
jgi:hypothetical protein